MGDTRLGFFPVCDDRGRAVGVVTDRDLAVRAFADGEPAGEQPISRIMTPGVLACRPEDDLGRAEALMRAHRTWRVLIVDEQGQPAGVISLADLVDVDGIDVRELVRALAERDVAPPRASAVHRPSGGLAPAAPPGPWLALRRRMVDNQIAARGVNDAAVLGAMLAVPREAFVPGSVAARAYDDVALPIGYGQTISQPYIVALMAEALRLRPTDRVLEIGAGSGYAAAVLATIAAQVFTIELRPELAAQAERRLRDLGYTNVHVIVGDGTRGLPEEAPFAAITVAAAGPTIPDALLAQLAPGGRLVMPVGDPHGEQTLLRLTRTGEATFRRELLGEVQFVPLVHGG
jgi:protein-L-isoaspartate(D-aspartate) O-methyltransferase